MIIKKKHWINKFKPGTKFVYQSSDLVRTIVKVTVDSDRWKSSHTIGFRLQVKECSSYYINSHNYKLFCIIHEEKIY